MDDAEDGDGDGDGDVEMDDADDGDGDGDADDGDGDENEGEEDAEEGEAEGDGGDGDGEGDADADADAGEDEDQDDNEDNDDEAPDSPSLPRPQHRRSQSKASGTPLPNGSSGTLEQQEREGSEDTIRKSISNSPKPSSGRGVSVYIRPSLRPEVITASTYDIVPTIAAPQSTSINAIAALPDMRWVFTGGTDGYIRKFNWVDTVNSKLMLTVAQRHPFVDSVIKAGVLQSYWENEDPAFRTPVKSLESSSAPLSPVYSLAVERQALWLMSGDESGVIKIQTVRHHEGEIITTLRKHTSAVSVLVLAPDEQSVLSGGWDKAIHDWDLNTGEPKRTYANAGGQISSIEPRPLSTLPIPQSTGAPLTTSRTFASNNADKPKASTFTNGNDKDAQSTAADNTATGDGDASPFGDMDSLFGDDDAGPMNPGLGDDDDDEFSRAIASAPQAPQTGDEENPLDISIDQDSKPSTLINTADDPKMDIDSEIQAPTDAKTIGSDSQATEQDAVPPSSLPISDDILLPSTVLTDSDAPTPSSETTFLDASFAGTLRVWDRRMPNPLATITPRMGTPPWCMSATWSPDGNYIYAGRRNNCVEEYSLHKGLRDPTRTLRLPGSSRAVSSLKAMPNGRHLICASHDIMRLYDLKNDQDERQHAVVPFLIIPGHRTGVISQLYLDPTGTWLISAAGARGWEAASNPPEVMLGYEVNCLT
jgi:transcriptional activator SPT8